MFKDNTIVLKSIREKIRVHAYPLLLLAVIYCIVYGKTLGHDFLINWDDNAYITDNETIKSFSPAHLKSIFTTNYVGNFAPLQIFSYMIDHSVWGMRPIGFILSNLLLHALNGIILYAIVVQVAGRRMWAFFACFIFLFHPVQVESVAWLSQRKTLLAMFFFLCSLASYIRYAKGIKYRNRYYWISVTAFVLSLLAKSVTVILPLLLLTYDFLYTRDSGSRRRLLDKVPYILLAAVFSVVTFKMQSPEAAGGRIPYINGSILVTLLTMLPVYVRYLSMLFYPVKLSATYSYSIKTALDADVIGSLLLLATLPLTGVWLYRRNKRLLFWFLAAFICFLPLSQIIPLVTLMNDRYLYIPLLGGATFLVGIVIYADEHLTTRRTRAALWAVFGIWLVSLPMITFTRVDVWQNSHALWNDAVKKSPDSFLAWNMLATTFMKEHNHAEAGKAFQRALAINPRSKEVLNNFAVLCQLSGSYERAEEYYKKLLAYYPDEVDALSNLGLLYYNMADYSNALVMYEKVLKLRPDAGRILMHAGSASFATGNANNARTYYQRALSGEMRAEAELCLACLDSLDGRIEQGLNRLEAAFQHGFRDLDRLEQAIELKQVKASPRYRPLLARYFASYYHDNQKQ